MAVAQDDDLWDMPEQEKPEPTKHPHLTPEEVHELRGLRCRIQYVGGPQCGKKIVCRPFRPPFHRIFFINRTLGHVYLLEGNLDDGFKFQYHGVLTYRCTGNGEYEVYFTRIQQ